MNSNSKRYSIENWTYSETGFQNELKFRSEMVSNWYLHEILYIIIIRYRFKTNRGKSQQKYLFEIVWIHWWYDESFR